MKRTTMFIPVEVERDLQSLARRERKPVAWVVREALSAYVEAHRWTPALPSFVGVGDSGRTDTAERHEELLWQDPHADASAPQTPRRRSRRMKKR